MHFSIWVIQFNWDRKNYEALVKGYFGHTDGPQMTKKNDRTEQSHTHTTNAESFLNIAEKDSLLK